MLLLLAVELLHELSAVVVRELSVQLDWSDGDRVRGVRGA